MEQALNSLKNSALGIKEISNDMLKYVTPEITQILLEMFDLWKNYTHPSEWKEAVIIHIIKPGKDPSSPSSYRLINLTCCLGKLLEKMVHDRLQWYLEKENILSPYQKKGQLLTI